MELHGQRALVTGAGKGIGRAIATALAQEGVHVGLVARTLADLEDLGAELQAAHGVGVSIATADVGSRAEVEAAVAHVERELGGIDILVNNAGIAGFGSIVDMDPDEWERIIRVNVFGTYYATRAALPGMIERGSGEVINVASTAGESGGATRSAYSASKAGVLRFTESLAAEVRKHDIRVTALLPSTVDTAMSVSLGLTRGDDDNMLQPEDVAELVIANLRLPRRVFVRNVAILTTNPK